MSTPDILALGLTFLTLFIYFVIGARRKSEVKTLDDFFFYGRSLDRPGYTKTFVATSISLATVLFFFLDYGGIFGMALILSPLSYSIGAWIFLRILPKLRNSGFLKSGTTLHNFLGNAFDHSAMRYSSAAISILGYLGIFVVELYVGVEVFKLFSTTSQWTAIVAIFLMLLILIYTYLGGYKAVIDTDRVQLFLIGTGTVLGLFTLLFLSQTSTPVHPLNFLPLPFPFLPVSFIIVILVGNIPFQILRMSHWQRAAAVADIEKIKQGLGRGILQNFGWWFLFLLMGVLLYHIADFTDPATKTTRLGAIVFLDLLRQSNALYSYFVYPILFTGFIAALMSTADTIFAAILTSYIYDFRHHSDLHENGNSSPPTGTVQQTALKSAHQGIVIFTIVAGVLYYLLVHVFQFRFVDLLFVFFTQQLALFPSVVIALRNPNGGSKPLLVQSLIGMWLGWASIWAFSLIGKYSNMPDLTLYASGIGWLISIITVLLLAPKRTFNLLRSTRNAN